MIIAATIYLILVAAGLTFFYCAGTLNRRADEQMEEWHRKG